MRTDRHKSYFSKDCFYLFSIIIFAIKALKKGRKKNRETPAVRASTTIIKMLLYYVIYIKRTARMVAAFWYFPSMISGLLILITR